ncbi:unnamed protein product [Caenorhabditis angaria]|uniref:Uncharacterized protein n=1 Tax=Caenorhabditis angaria TaxID=860376 RepID=A0A9P1I5J6_9PELO|nr:unnamed protein product [Caenorhabditis angaria]
MAANRQIFKIKGDEFNLDFIELLHKSGEIRENDVIQIADKSGAPFQPFTLKFLEKRYGIEHPFRRGFQTGQIHNFSDSQDNDDSEEENNKNVIYVVNSTPSASRKQSSNTLGKIDLIKKDLGIKIKNRLLKYRRFPLIFDPKDKSVDKSKLMRFIHGSALKKVFKQIDQNTIKHLDGFFAPLIEKIGYPNSCTLCGIVQEPVMYSIISHIVSDQHYSNLKKYGFFEVDYQFLVESLEFLKTKMKAKPSTNKKNNAKKEKPLVKRKVLSQNSPNILTNSNKIVEKPLLIDKFVNISTESISIFPLIYDSNIKTNKNLLPFRHSEKLKVLFDNFDEVTVNRNNGFFDVLFDVIGYPKKCDVCNQKLFNDPYSIITHISTEKHVENLVKFGALNEDYRFWSQLAYDMRDFYMKPKASSRNCCEIPLLYNPQQKYMGEKTTFKNGDAFRKTMKKLNADFIDLVLKKFFKNVGYPASCKLCTEPLEQKPSNVLYHLISPQHYMSLRNNGFYVRDYSFWINILQAISSNYCQVKETNVSKFVNESKDAQIKKSVTRRRARRRKQQLAN